MPAPRLIVAPHCGAGFQPAHEIAVMVLFLSVTLRFDELICVHLRYLRFLRTGESARAFYPASSIQHPQHRVTSITPLRRHPEEPPLKPPISEPGGDESDQREDQEHDGASEDPVDHRLAHGPDIIDGGCHLRNEALRSF